MFDPPRRSWVTEGPAVFFLAWPKSGRVGVARSTVEAARLAEFDGRPAGDGFAVRDPGIVAVVDVHDQLEGGGQAPLHRAA